MRPPVLDAPDLVALCAVGAVPDGPPLVLVDLRGAVTLSERDREIVTERLRTWPVVVAGVLPAGDALAGEALAPLLDLVLGDDDPLLDAVATNVAARPVAAVTTVLLLRATEHSHPAAALVAESLAYSTLQAGPEFAAWREAHPPDAAAAAGWPEEDGPAVTVEPAASGVLITLNRPSRHNAISRRLRSELHDALLAAALDPTSRVTLAGAGPSFSSGGDLGEFGLLRDPATAHLVRLQSHPAAALIALGAERVEAFVHGACLGGGLELAAYAGRIVADRGTELGLPEIHLGLLPGAGGTVSLPRRIGRQRTALLALTAVRLDAATALRWGLVDEVASRRT